MHFCCDSGDEKLRNYPKHARCCQSPSQPFKYIGVLQWHQPFKKRSPVSQRCFSFKCIIKFAFFCLIFGGSELSIAKCMRF